MNSSYDPNLYGKDFQPLLKKGERCAGCGKYKAQIFGAILTVFLVTLAVLAVIFIQSPNRNAPKRLQIEDIIRGNFSAKLVSPVWLSNGDYLFQEQTNGSKLLMRYDSATFSSKPFIDTSDLLLNGKSYADDFFVYYPSIDNSLVLFGTGYVKQFRHSYFANWIVYNTKTKLSFSLLAGKASNPTWNPSISNLDSLAIVVDNNIQIFSSLSVPENITSVNVTTDGSKLILNGIMDWVYEEEVFSSSPALWWSPDGAHLAYLRLDDTDVGEAPYDWFVAVDQDAYPQMKTVRYPKPGTPNPKVSVHVYSVIDNDKVQMKLLPGTEYVTTVSWTEYRPGELAVRVLPRVQQVETLCLNNITNGEIMTTFVTQNMPNGWVESRTNSYIFVNSTHFVDIRENNDYYHVALQNVMGGSKPIIFLTSGPYEVTEIVGYDSTSKQIFFISTEDSAIKRQLYTVNLNGNKQKLTGSLPHGFFTCKWGPGNVYVLEGSSATIPPEQWVVPKSAFSTKHVISENSQIKKHLEDYNVPKKTFVKIPLDDGKEVNAYMIHPHAAIPGVLYPVLFTLYQGPSSSTVLDKWTLAFNEWVSTTMKFIVIAIDGAGTAGRSVSFNQSPFKRLGIPETETQIAAMKKVLSMRKDVDWNRVALWGWSYGGFMTLDIALHAPKLLRAAISVAPVTDWRLYDSFYTERYMLTPNLNEEGYNKTSMVNYVKQFGKDRFGIQEHNKTHLYLVHGIADDNVHFQNSALFASNMIKGDVPFKSAYYPNQDHAINKDGSLLHLYHSIRYFLKQHVIEYSFIDSHPEL